MSKRGQRVIAEARRSRSAKPIHLSAPKGQPLLGPGLGTLLQPGSSTPSATGEIGVPGNLNLSGFLTGEDYNHDLDGAPAMAVYDEMRRSDAQVAAILLMCTLRIKAGTWNITPATDDGEDQAVADFCKAALLDDEAMSIQWSDVLDNALLKLPFGCSAHEKVWFVDETGALRLKKLAPRLPRTFYRWLEDPQTNELAALQQFAPRGGSYGFFDIPKDALVLHVLNREGNNYFGRSMLRAAYPHWWRKQQLYKIDMVKHDRWGVGIPVAKLDKDYNTNDTPIDKIEQALSGLRSYERGYVIEPCGVTIRLLIPESGGKGGTDALGSIEHHNMLIARSAIQGFAAQGEQAHGSFGAAAITFQAFEDAEQGTARELASEFRMQVLKPLCENNFDMSGGRKTPKLECTGLGKIDIKDVAPALKSLVDAKLLTPDDTLEDFIRTVGKLPPLPEELRGQDRTPMVAVPGNPFDPNADPNADPDDAPSKNTPGKTQKKKPKVDAAKVRYSEGARAFAREPNDLERRVFNCHQVPDTLDTEKARLTRVVAGLRKQHLQQLATSIAKKDARKSTGAFTDIRPDQIAPVGLADITAVIRTSQDVMADYGADQVRAELQKQGRFPTITAHTAAESKKTMKSALTSSAKITAGKVATQWRDLALENALRLRRSGLVGQALVDAIIAELDDDLEVGLGHALGGEVNEAFGLGRAVTAGQLTDEIEKATYSCLLDASSCDPCIALDGKEFIVGTPEYDAAMPPYRKCDGRDSCRCVYIYTLKTTP